MSLAPGERWVLARIERELRRSDPKLAAKLEQFALPRRRDAARQLSWPLRRLPRILVVSVLTVVPLGLVLSGLALISQVSPAHGVDCARPAAMAGWGHPGGCAG